MTKFGPLHCDSNIIVYTKIIYLKHVVVVIYFRENVARGNTILCLNNLESGAVRYDCMVFALRKFTGGMGDEDEDQPENNKVWTDYFLKPIETTAKVICTRKANGEAAHLAVRYIQNRFVLCVGSKNVHMLISDRSDIDKYSEDRFQVARYVAEAIMSLVENLDKTGSAAFLFNFMHYTRLTAVFEVLNPASQHVEDLSHLKQTELRFISWTSSYEDRKNNLFSYCAINPKVGIDLARNIGLQTVEYEMIEPNEVDQRMNKIRHDYGYEGEVLYFVDSEDNVIGLLKKKTAWYVVARAIREQSANALAEWNKKGELKYDHASREERMVKRLKAIKTWLDLSDESCKAWTNIGKGFLAWVIRLAAEKPDNDKSVEEKNEKYHKCDIELRSKFPWHWKEYLKHSQQSDIINW